MAKVWPFHREPGCLKRSFSPNFCYRELYLLTWMGWKHISITWRFLLFVLRKEAYPRLSVFCIASPPMCTPHSKVLWAWPAAVLCCKGGEPVGVSTYRVSLTSVVSLTLCRSFLTTPPPAFLLWQQWRWAAGWPRLRAECSCQGGSFPSRVGST